MRTVEFRTQGVDDVANQITTEIDDLRIGLCQGQGKGVTTSFSVLVGVQGGNNLLLRRFVVC